MQAGNRQSYQTLRDQSLRERAAQGTAATVNAMEPTQPPVSVAGAQRLKARTNVSTAPPEKPITDANPRQYRRSSNAIFLQKVIDGKKFTQDGEGQGTGSTRQNHHAAAGGDGLQEQP